jgi:hypothetical protein
VSCMTFYERGLQGSITPISSLLTIVLWSGATSLDPLRDLAHSGLHDPE